MIFKKKGTTEPKQTKTTKKAKAAKKISKQAKAVEKTSKRAKVDLDALAAAAKTSITATDYQAYLRNKLKGIK